MYAARLYIIMQVRCPFSLFSQVLLSFRCSFLSLLDSLSVPSSKGVPIQLIFSSVDDQGVG